MNNLIYNGTRSVVIEESGIHYLKDTLISGASFFQYVSESREFRHGIRFALISMGLITQEENDELTLAISNYQDK